MTDISALDSTDIEDQTHWICEYEYQNIVKIENNFKFSSRLV